ISLFSCWLSPVGVRACHGTAPPWVADQALELGGVLPIGPKGFGESGFEVIQGVEDGVGEDPAQRLEPALRRVEFGAVGWQRDLLDAQWALPLVCLPLLSSPSPIVSLPVCWRNSSRKRWKQTPSTCGRNSTTQVPLPGSTAAYSQNQWGWWSWVHGGRLPNGHHSRRCVTFRPKRASSMANAPRAGTPSAHFLKAACSAGLT